MKNQKVNPAALSIAIEEADELFNHAVQVDNTIQLILKKGKNNSPVGKIISANILIGLSIEIYLKAFMIAGRREGMVRGHKLNELYKEFPHFLRKTIEDQFRVRKKKNSMMIETAFKTSEDIPEKPEGTPFDGVDFDDFNSCLNAISEIFVESRYFFEKINADTWTIVKYHFESSRTIAVILKSVLVEYREGKFKGQQGDQ